MDLSPVSSAACDDDTEMRDALAAVHRVVDDRKREREFVADVHKRCEERLALFGDAALRNEARKRMRRELLRVLGDAEPVGAAAGAAPAAAPAPAFDEFAFDAPETQPPTESGVSKAGAAAAVDAAAAAVGADDCCALVPHAVHCVTDRLYRLQMVAFDATHLLRLLERLYDAVSVERRTSIAEMVATFKQRHPDTVVPAGVVFGLRRGSSGRASHCVFCLQAIPKSSYAVGLRGVAEAAQDNKVVAHHYHPACAAFLSACGAKRCFCVVRNITTAWSCYHRPRNAA